MTGWGGGGKKFSDYVGVWKWNALITVVMGYCSDIKLARESLLIYCSSSLILVMVIFLSCL